MITYVVCDIFASPAQTLVNTVNTVGVMGKGIAKDFKVIYPAMFTRYQELCEKGQFNIGQLWPYRTSNKLVLNFPTKKHWRNPSRPEYIEAGLKTFVDKYHVYGVTSVSFPLLGCGNGELDWESQVRPLMERYLGELPMDIYIHLQDQKDPFALEHRDLRQMMRWLRSEPGSLSFNEVWADLVAVIAAEPMLTNIHTGNGFDVRLSSVGDSIIFEGLDNSIQVPQRVFLDLWQQLRASGFISGNHLPSGLSEYSGMVIPLLAKLPYISEVNLASRSHPLSVGLRVVPAAEKPQQPQLSLFSSAVVVEPE